LPALFLSYNYTAVSAISFHPLFVSFHTIVHCTVSYSKISCGRFKNYHIMKNILLAAALLFIAASALLVVANSHPALREQCEHEWEKGFEVVGIDDTNYLPQNIIFSQQ
jgi:hypothetical protein